MGLEKRYMILPDVRFGTSDLFVEEVEVIDTYMKHVDPIAKVYVNESLGTVFMPLSMLYKTKRDALVALWKMCKTIAAQAEKELKVYEQHEDPNNAELKNLMRCATTTLRSVQIRSAIYSVNAYVIRIG